MTRSVRSQRRAIAPSPLMRELWRFVQLRWFAAAAVVASAVVDARWLHWYSMDSAVLRVGLAIVGYNLLLLLFLRQLERTPPDQVGSTPIVLSWVQLLMDLASLSLLTAATGGLNSPVEGFFALHMVFSSLLLPRRMAYAGATAAVVMRVVCLWGGGLLPQDRQQWAAVSGWGVALFVTVWLTNQLVGGLRRQRRRLVRQNRRISRMSRLLRRQQEGMIQHEKMATAGRMAAGVAHEIANPLASMDGLLQLLQRRPEKLTPEALATLREQVARISRILRDMTTFAHPGQANWEEMELNAVVEKAMVMVRFDPRFDAVQLTSDLPAGLPRVRLMPEAMQQVVLNLVINALDAVEGVEHPCIQLRTHAADGSVVIEIADNGHGIAPAHRRHLFEPFFTTKPVGKGTGLGLSISYSLVEQHGGDIQVETEIGRGTKFIVRLPSSARPATA
ncbi:MAG: sensor histidine kinase [Tepidisphaerales bacterium]